MSRTTRKRKQELTGIINFDSTGNLGFTAANLQGPSAEPRTQPFLQQYQHRQFQNQHKPHDHQPSPTPVSNPVPYCPTSEIQDNRECISERSTAPLQVPATQAPKLQALLIQAPQRQVIWIHAPPIPAPSVPALSVQAPPVQRPPTSAPLAPLALVECDRGQPGKHPEQVKIVLDKLDTFTNKYADAQLSASGQKQGLLEKDVFKVVIPNKVITPE